VLAASIDKAMRGISELMPRLLQKFEVHVISRIGRARAEMDWIGDMRGAIPALAPVPDDRFHFVSECWEKVEQARRINAWWHVDNSLECLAPIWKGLPNCNTILFRDSYNARSLSLLQSLNAVPEWNTTVDGWQDCIDLLLP
jgi:hypothetical protein